MIQPKMFIGSSSETVRFADALKESLKEIAHVEVWDEVLRPGYYTLEELVSNAEEVDFAAFIVGSDDITLSRNEMQLSARDNVIYEAGLFAGHIGIPNTFLLIDKAGVKMPSDWKGLGYLTYDSKMTDVRIVMKDAAETIKKQITNWIEKTDNIFENRIAGKWWQFVINEDKDSVLSWMEIYRSPDKKNIEIRGESWTDKGIQIAKYFSKAIAVDESKKTIFYYWEGEHPHDTAASKFFGCGEITFSVRSSDTLSAEGWYSESALNELDQTTRKSVLYYPATDDQKKTMDKGDHLPVKKLINHLLKMRKQLINERIPGK